MKILRSLTVLKEFAAQPPVQLISNTDHDPQYTKTRRTIHWGLQQDLQEGRKDLFQLLIHQPQKNSSTDAEPISSLKQQLSEMFPDQSDREKAEKRIQSGTNRSLSRKNISQKRPAASRKKQLKENNELRTIKAKLNELTTLIKIFLPNAKIKRELHFTHVCLFTGSSRANPP